MLRNGDILELMVLEWGDSIDKKGILVELGVVGISRNEKEIEVTEDMYLEEKDMYHRIKVITPTAYKERGYNIVEERRGLKKASWKEFEEVKDMIGDIYANPEEEWLWENGKRIKVFSEIKKGEVSEEEYERLRVKEEKRKELESIVLEEWNNMTEEEQREYLEEVFIRRMISWKGSEISKLEKGLVIRCKYNITQKGNNWYKGYKSVVWDKEEWSWDIYGIESKGVSKSDKKKADNINNLRMICFG